jgi:hypothetical protein
MIGVIGMRKESANTTTDISDGFNSDGAVSDVSGFGDVFGAVLGVSQCRCVSDVSGFSYAGNAWLGGGLALLDAL